MSSPIFDCCAFSYVVDAADKNKLAASKSEFHALLEKPQLEGIPILVLANKNDIEGSLAAEELIENL